MQKAIHDKRFFTSLLLGLGIFLLPLASFAFGGDTPVSQGLGYLLTAMYGGTGIAIATLAIIVVGLLCLGHYIKWHVFLVTVAGIAIIFGAPAIVTGIKALVNF